VEGRGSAGVDHDHQKTIPSRQRDPWNKGHLIGQKRPLKRVGGSARIDHSLNISNG
jgi:hypothetical protein